MRKGPVLLAIAVGLCLCGCGATAEIPTDAGAVATPESSAVGLMRPETDTSASYWLMMSALQESIETALPDAVQLDVERIPQNPELPNGCEITSPPWR